MCVWLSVPTFGIRWFEAVTGAHGDKIDFGDIRFERLKTLLSGHMDVTITKVEKEKPAKFARRLKAVRDRLEKALRKYDAMKNDFGFQR